MARRHPPGGGLAWQVADCTDLAGTPDGSYDLVLDKATLDALMSLAPGQGRGYRQGEGELAQVRARLGRAGRHGGGARAGPAALQGPGSPGGRRAR